MMVTILADVLTRRTCAFVQTVNLNDPIVSAGKSYQSANARAEMHLSLSLSLLLAPRQSGARERDREGGSTPS